MVANHIFSFLLLENNLGMGDSFLNDSGLYADQVRGKNWLPNQGEVFSSYQQHLHTIIKNFNSSLFYYFKLKLALFFKQIGTLLELSSIKCQNFFYKNFRPGNNFVQTFSSLILSPASGGQLPSTTIKSSLVTLNCFPQICTWAKSLP